jgi:hypothetical protein
MLLGGFGGALLVLDVSASAGLLAAVCLVGLVAAGAWLTARESAAGWQRPSVP